MWDDLLELRQILSEVIKDLFALFGICISNMLLDHILQLQYIVFGCNFGGRNHVFVDLCIQIIVFIEYISDTAAHTGCKVLADTSKDDCTATCHIFTAVIADTFHNSDCTGVTNAETFSRYTVDKGFTACCAVQCHVTDDNVLILLEFAALRWIYDQLTA